MVPIKIKRKSRHESASAPIFLLITHRIIESELDKDQSKGNVIISESAAKIFADATQEKAMEISCAHSVPCRRIQANRESEKNIAHSVKQSTK